MHQNVCMSDVTESATCSGTTWVPPPFHSVANVDLNARPNVWLFLPAYQATDHFEGYWVDGLLDDGTTGVPKHVGYLLKSDLYTFGAYKVGFIN
jgi:hypothetical protein